MITMLFKFNDMDSNTPVQTPISFYISCLSYYSNVKRCLNCNCKIGKLNITNISHILPKNKFKSIAFNKENIFILCSDCHCKYDQSISNITKTNLKFRVISFINNVYKNLPDEEKRMANKYITLLS